jgi:hypothetical protein
MQKREDYLEACKTNNSGSGRSKNISKKILTV